MSNTKAIKSYQGFEEGSFAARKGRLCVIKKIHFEMQPPSVTVLMKDTDTEVGTEFDRLKHIKSWFCGVCTAQNDDASATKCSFCKMNRSFKEKLIIQDENEQESNQECKSSENTKQSESTELISSSESDETEPDQNVEQEPEQEPEQEENDIHDEYEIINAPQHKEPEYEQEEDEESESESEEDEYEDEPQNHGHNGYYYDDDEYTKYQNRNRMNRNRMNRNRNRDSFGFGWNAFPSFDRFFL